MRMLFPTEYRFCPRTWVLPQDQAELTEEFALARPGEKPRTYIVKPSAGSQGAGIYLAQRLDDIRPNAEVVQRYVDKPFLVDGYKFDLRIYVLVQSVDPLRIYIANEGLARFCTTPYEPVTRANMAHTYMHLTNYSLNKHNQNFVPGQTEDEGSKRSLSSINRWLAQHGHDVEALWSRITEVIIKTLVAIQPTLCYVYRCGVANPDPAHSMCFHVVGFDVLLDYRLRPWILEINHSPSLLCDAELDCRIKEQLVTGAMLLALGRSSDPPHCLVSDSRLASGVPGAGWSLCGGVQFFRLVYPNPPATLPYDRLNIFNSDGLHDAFMRACGVRVRGCGMSSLKFGRFGRSIGMADGRSISQADLDTLYREVMKHRPADTLMGYGEFCTALVALAARKYPDVALLQAPRLAHHVPRAVAQQVGALRATSFSPRVLGYPEAGRAQPQPPLAAPGRASPRPHSRLTPGWAARPPSRPPFSTSSRPAYPPAGMDPAMMAALAMPPGGYPPMMMAMPDLHQQQQQQQQHQGVFYPQYQPPRGPPGGFPQAGWAAAGGGPPEAAPGWAWQPRMAGPGLPPPASFSGYYPRGPYAPAGQEVPQAAPPPGTSYPGRYG
ncbi:putative tubulin polyglutamylase TTLL6 [Paratrimastix pyriformis]|uniref:Tubulin polyglutamylase TTLL6 n=1 Tax=Paratrimastix pyriformis TaxID=342808 RepID=A0ABQ8UNX8_9EUKA|nr:putative tubulin polyglutamylase TTLL6 [Paratrimastix pyriformis]